MRKNIWFPLIFITILWIVGIGGIYAGVIINKSLNATIINLEPNFLFYSDAAALHPINKISLPDVTQGSVTDFTFYVKNVSPVSQIVSAGSIFLPASTGTLKLTFDGQTQKTLAANSVARVDGTLTVLNGATRPDDLTILINSSPQSTNTASTTLPPLTTTNPTTIPPTTVLTTTTQVLLNGQTIYNASCLSCHPSLPRTNNRTQAQLLTFLSNHNTGRTLTKEQLTAVAVFLKP
jgi:hypothetical protein